MNYHVFAGDSICGKRLAMRAAHDGVSLIKWVAKTLEEAVSV